jgi:hypothetical protein
MSWVLLKASTKEKRAEKVETTYRTGKSAFVQLPRALSYILQPPLLLRFVLNVMIASHSSF